MKKLLEEIKNIKDRIKNFISEIKENIKNRHSNEIDTILKTVTNKTTDCIDCITDIFSKILDGIIKALNSYDWSLLGEKIINIITDKLFPTTVKAMIRFV